MTAAPAWASWLDWFKSNSELVESGPSGFAICWASRCKFCAPVAMVDRPLLKELYTFTEGRLPRVFIATLSAALVQALAGAAGGS
jgi:hypothetical protein